MEHLPFSWDDAQDMGDETSSPLFDKQRKFLLRVMSSIAYNPSVFIDNYEDLDQEALEDFMDDIINRLCE